MITISTVCQEFCRLLQPKLPREVKLIPHKGKMIRISTVDVECRMGLLEGDLSTLSLFLTKLVEMMAEEMQNAREIYIIDLPRDSKSAARAVYNNIAVLTVLHEGRLYFRMGWN